MKHALEGLDIEEMLALKLVLGEYLDRFSDQQIEEAHQASQIRICVRLYNRLKNLQHGYLVDFDVDRKPMHRLNGGVK